MSKTLHPTPSPLDWELLRGIRSLDRDGRNRLPIPTLREAMPSVPRETLDRALLRLVGLGWIRLSTIQETRQVTPEQLAAGIPAPGGAVRFYIVVLPEAPADAPLDLSPG